MQTDSTSSSRLKWTPRVTLVSADGRVPGRAPACSSRLRLTTCPRHANYHRFRRHGLLYTAWATGCAPRWNVANTLARSTTTWFFQRGMPFAFCRLVPPNVTPCYRVTSLPISAVSPITSQAVSMKKLRPFSPPGGSRYRPERVIWRTARQQHNPCSHSLCSVRCAIRVQDRDSQQLLQRGRAAGSRSKTDLIHSDIAKKNKRHPHLHVPLLIAKWAYKLCSKNAPRNRDDDHDQLALGSSTRAASCSAQVAAPAVMPTSRPSCCHLAWRSAARPHF